MERHGGKKYIKGMNFHHRVLLSGCWANAMVECIDRRLMALDKMVFALFKAQLECFV